MRDFSSRPRRRPPQPVDLGLIGIGVLTLIFAGYATGTSWADFKRARQHVADVRRDTQAAQARLKTMEARSAPTAALATQALLSTDAAPPRVLAELAALMPPDLKLDSLSLSYGEGIGMSMHVSAKNAGKPVQVRAFAVQAVEGDDARDAELVGRLPHLFGRDLRAVDAVHDDQRGVGHPQRRPRVTQEVGHSGRVDEVDLGLIPLNVGHAGGESVLARDFFFVVIGDGRPVVHLPETIDRPRVEQQGRDELCLPGA